MVFHDHLLKQAANLYRYKLSSTLTEMTWLRVHILRCYISCRPPEKQHRTRSHQILSQGAYAQNELPWEICEKSNPLS